MAIENAHTKLTAKFRRNPSVDEMYDYLAENDDMGVVVDEKPGILIWEDAKGHQHETRRKTLANILSRINKGT